MRSMKSLGFALLAVWTAACSRGPDLRLDPFYGSFLEKTMLIMTAEEFDLYLNLPDKAGKAAFIKEFWEIRDPLPETEANENRIEFERRVAFANEWFGRLAGCQTKPDASKRKSGWGWNTLRGMAFITFGPPDHIGLTSSGGTFPLTNPEDGFALCRADRWLYGRLNTTLYFRQGRRPVPSGDENEDASGSFGTDSGFASSARVNPRLSRPPNGETWKRAKLEWVNAADRLPHKPFDFKASYDGRELKIGIPVKTISFRVQDDGRLKARFQVEAHVYLDRARIDTLRKTQTFDFAESEAEKLDQLEIRVPSAFPKKGRCLFDIVVGLDDGTGFSRCRRFLEISR
jgi:GWxTD domain-containing protein